MAGFARKVLGLIVWLNLFLLVFVAVSGDIAESSWVTMLVANLPVIPFLLPSAVIAVLAMMTRQVILAGMHVAGIFVAFLVLVPVGAPKASVPFFGAQAATRRVRVMTYNLGHGRGDVDAIVAAILAEKPDVICLQDVDTDQADAPLQVKMREDLRAYNLHIEGGMAIGSRFRENSYRTFTLPFAPNGKVIQDVSFDWNGYPVRVVNVQFNRCEAERVLFEDSSLLPSYLGRLSVEQGDQTEAILKLVPGDPPIICGDFGGPPRGPRYRKLRKVMHDTFSESGEGIGLTWPSRVPLERPDAIFVAYGWKTDRCWIPRTGGSDHLPLLADVVPFTP